MNKKITIVGAGNVGSQAALFIAQKNLGNVVLIDVVQGIPQGKALDILEAMPLFKSDSKVIGTNNYEDTKDSDIVIVTAGLARKPGMTREDLLKINQKIMTEVISNIKKYSKNYILIIVTNPLDAMVHAAYKLSDLPKNKVIGMGGMLDSSRFNSFVAQELDVSVNKVNCIVIGSHGEAMIPSVEHSFVDKIPLSKLLPKEKSSAIVGHVKKAGLEIVEHLKTGSAFFAPGAAIASMVENIVLDQNKIMPCTVYLDGEYGIDGVFLGVPVKLGKNGVEEIIEIELNNEEKITLEKSAQSVKKLIGELAI